MLDGESYAKSKMEACDAFSVASHATILSSPDRTSKASEKKI